PGSAWLFLQSVYRLWGSQLRLGIISDENKQKLTEWMLYA
ncbi:TPA: tail fiber assembly protein, partial [Escherichia coli]|nr:tail fiber assembly protein [Escherichia coli]